MMRQRWLTVLGTVAGLVLALSSPSSATPAQAVQLAGRTQGTYQYAGTTNPDQSLIVTWLPRRQSAPWVVLIHGGSWINGSTANTAAEAELFYSHGWQAFNLNFRNGTTVTYAQQCQDLRVARNWILRHAATFHIDPHRGSLYGFSSGGHLAAILGLGGTFRTVVSASGVLQPQRVATDALGLGPDPAPAPVGIVNLYRRERSMIGSYVSVYETSASALRWRAFCPQFALTKNSPAFYIMQGREDVHVPPGTAPSFGYACRALGIRHQVVMVSACAHTNDVLFGSWDRQIDMLRYVLGHSA